MSIVPCTAYELDFWQYDEDCCLDRTANTEFPSCVVGEGGCANDAHCEGTLVCREGSCDPDFFDPEHNCCVGEFFVILTFDVRLCGLIDLLVAY